MNQLPKHNTAANNPQSDSLTQARLLIIEDDANYGMVLARSLARYQFSCHHCEQAEQALAEAQAFQPSHVLLDLNLGTASGLNLVSPLRQQHPTAKIVLLTGYASIVTAVQAIKAGADDYLPKPADPALIAQTLHSGTAEQPPVSPQQPPPSPKRLEWEHIQRVLADHDGNVSAAARALGMHRRSLQRKLLKKPVKR